MKLYDCTQAPNPRRVRIFLAEKGIDIDKVQIDILSGENLQADFLAVNSRGVLPVLELDDGTRIDETVAICQYFEVLQPSPSLMGDDAKTKALISSRQRQVEFDGLLPLADIVRNSVPAFSTRALPGREGVDAIEALVARGINSFNQFLDRLDKTLGESQYLAGDAFSIADITALCVIDFAQWAQIEIPKHHENTLRWYSLVSQRESVKA